MKKYLLGIFAVALAIGFSAFTQPAVVKKSTVGEKWFHFTGSNNIPGDLADATKYTLDGDGTSPSFCESADSYMCEILISVDPNNPSKPDLQSDPIDQTGRTTP